jgi:hypothetical protein
MRAFTSALSVSVAAFPATPQFLLGAAVRTKRDPFTKFGVVFMWRTGVKVEYSFDGVTVHGDLEEDLLSQGLSFDNVTLPFGAIWFRCSTGTSTVRVEAFAQP